MTADNFKHTLEVLNQFGEAIIAEYRAELEADQNSNGELYRTLSYKVTTVSGGWTIKLNLAAYWKYLEYGRKPGKMPPVSAIKNWIEVKHIVPRPLQLKPGKSRVPTINQLSYLIARKIGRDGTKGKHTFESSFDKVKSAFYTKIEQAIQEDIKEVLK